ncbi:hypothetical protein [Saccharomonospora xinjiangensis]|uniref:HEAT repeat protein n=1 Tax=Saccharomonospora xinjiangensis XJ-54 TaxID=882086 RepID=I0V8K5_9PSEU|nr:hypothetical protein [Saccharomonospora xinjiangensis]EID56458.1 hypothetical protein SacxiDRAFT_4277 [Saccharomonospora xinjiangensis XJ-54]
MGEGDRSRLCEFSARLRSDDPEVVLDALDDYLSAQAATRWGVDNPYTSLDSEVLFAARELLGRAPIGPGHVSALAVMWHLAEEEDADVIADVLDGTPDAEVRATALLAASTALTASEEPNRRLLALITAMVLDENLDAQTRKDAVQALEDLDLPEIEHLMVRLADSAEEELQVRAVSWLAAPLRLRVHRELVRRVVECWPEDVGGEAGHLRREVLDGFHSTYWTDTEPDDPALRKAHEELRFPSGDEECLRAFATLLHSDDPVAVGIALDHFESSRGLTRVLKDRQQAEDYLPEVLCRAREVLRRPLPPAEVSALNLLRTQPPEHGDADLLLEVLSRTRSDAVRQEALWVVHGLLDGVKVRDERLVGAVRDLLAEPSVGFAVKETAIRVLADGLGADADPVLLRALRECEPRVQAHAAYFLVNTGGLDRHRAVLEDAADSWGDQPPSRPWGSNPIDLILGSPHSVHWKGHRLTDPDLARAHRRLRAPTMDDSYHEALRTLLNSGDPAAVGIALDHWWSPDGAVRRGGEQTREPEKALVADRVREILRQPPPPESRGTHRLEPRYLSALSALDVLAADDPTLLAEIVKTAGSDHLRERVLDTVETVVANTGTVDRRLGEALGNIACDGGVPVRDRARALELLGDAGSDFVPLLLRATRCPEPAVQAAAAWGLLGVGAENHRDLVEKLIESWPVDDAPWEVTRVRDRFDPAGP